jgi:hypothetical protein
MSAPTDICAALIVNADDYGFTPAVSAGIRAAHNEGIVTSTSVLIVAPSARDDLRKAAVECPGLGIGVHLTITGGWRPMLGRRVGSLRTYRGRLLGSSDLRAVMTRAHPTEVHEEWRAQIEAVLESGVQPDHLDAHHHVAYRSRELMEVLLELAAHYKLPVRLPVTSPGERRAAPNAHATEHTTGQLLSDEHLGQLVSAGGISHPDGLMDGFAGGITRAGLIGSLERLGPGELVELMCHPGRVDWRLKLRSSYTSPRAQELAVLTDERVRRWIDDLGVQLTTFGALSDPPAPGPRPGPPLA